MFKNALVGVDGRPSGRDAIALASRLSEGRLTLAHVQPGNVHPLRAISPGLAADERDAAVKLLEGERQEADADAELVTVEASTPGAGLHKLAEQRGAELLVVRAMLGDDTRAALNGSPCAVAIASRGYAERPAPIAKIGVAYNGSPES